MTTLRDLMTGAAPGNALNMIPLGDPQTQFNRFMPSPGMPQPNMLPPGPPEGFDMPASPGMIPAEAQPLALPGQGGPFAPPGLPSPSSLKNQMMGWKGGGRRRMGRA